MGSNINPKSVLLKFNSLEEIQFLRHAVKKYWPRKGEKTLKKHLLQELKKCQTLINKKPLKSRRGLLIHHELANVYIVNGITYLDRIEAEKELAKYAEQESETKEG